MTEKKTELKRLFSPFEHTKLPLKNRLVQMPMLTRFHDEKGYMTDRSIEFMVSRAKGGVALIMTENAYLSSNAHYRPNQLACYDDSYIPGLRSLTKAIHACDCKIGLQLMHAGTRLSESQLPGAIPVAPSAIPHIATAIVPHELTEEDIEALIDSFVQAARRVVESGFDAVDIHGAHGYLINQFCSPFNNKRTDRYGGSPERRAKLACEIIKRVREQVGPGFPILYRLTACDFVEGGIDLEEAKIHARLVEEAGVDILNVTAGNREAIDMHLQPNIHPRGCLLDLTKEIRKTITIPVIAVGRIVDPFQAEEILENGIADLIGLARAQLADPEFANKAREGRYHEINQCIGCLTGCIEKDFKKRPEVTCAVNPACGREKDFEIEPAAKPNKVVVVGGGPAGMSAAKVAAERGHRVWLYEKGPSLGGQLQVASVYNGKFELNKVTDWYVYKLKKLGVHVELNRDMTPEKVLALNPDAVIIATGARITIPDIPGIHGDNVVTAIDVLAGRNQPKDRVVVVGGGIVGIETAFYLAEKGKKVKLVEQLPKIGNNIGLTFRIAYWRKLPLLDIQIFTEAELFEVRKDGVNVVIKMEVEHAERKGYELIFIPADTVVLATGLTPERTLMRGLEGKVPELYTIGDCVEPLKIVDAIHEGANVALGL